ncbi:hypothetical protein BDV25DRAFT_160463 [Aspergillus avenaceus]|uniref:Uncharacterized protein n=1 Tax=Aspergillus avenaceus TaxID=36643 RepID=A0A5N6TM68_ASPAV|nr:hypothetical protein BDV25DRAFT_160463 [Aspergillus avenaceus]
MPNSEPYSTPLSVVESMDFLGFLLTIHCQVIGIHKGFACILVPKVTLFFRRTQTPSMSLWSLCFPMSSNILHTLRTLLLHMPSDSSIIFCVREPTVLSLYRIRAIGYSSGSVLQTSLGEEPTYFCSKGFNSYLVTSFLHKLGNSMS